MPLAFISCSDDTDVEAPLDVDFEVPASMVVSKNADCVFSVRDGKAPLASDLMMMENASGISYEGVLTSVSPENFSVKFPASMASGEYRVHLKRGDRKKAFGKTEITVVDRIISPEDGATVYGFISTPSGEGIAGVQVSDGFEIVITDSEGVYQLNSKKALGYVFYTVPSGYEPREMASCRRSISGQSLVRHCRNESILLSTPLRTRMTTRCFSLAICIWRTARTTSISSIISRMI